ncbi:hypothetical protein [Tenacibaculum halocynthiae]|uniref:hypothetical protein n=1 Tax=Tenacibaculum halocynthiae TaxID=1254437 RepID=UPI003892F689
MEEEKSQTIQKVKSFFPYILAIVCVASLYSFEFFQNFSDEFVASENKYKASIKNVTTALNKVKNEATETEAYAEYLKAREIKDKFKSEYYKIRKEEKVFGFKSLQLFMAEFGPMLCFFMYSLYMLFRSFYFEKKNNGMKFLHGLILTGPIFYFYWMFQPFQDVSKMFYYFMTVFSVIMMVFTIYLITKYRNHRINKLKENQLELAKFAFKNTKPEKREEMLSTIKKVARNV